MFFTIRLEGTTSLLMHNPQMVDPNFSICREIKAITAKRKKTDEDFKAIDKLEWYGGIYKYSSNGEKEWVGQPTSKVRKCLINTAKITRQGKSIERSVSFLELYVPLEHEGPASVDELFEKDPQYHSRLSVVVSGKRIMRVRPEFFPWALELEGVFIEDAGLNWDEFERVAELAGQVEGIGDNRVNGHGRFNVKLVKKEEETTSKKKGGKVKNGV